MSSFTGGEAFHDDPLTSSNETSAMVIKGDRNQDVSDHKEQADLFAQFYESLTIPSKGTTI
jgi:hypothetical protein